MSRTERVFDLLQVLRRYRYPVTALALAGELGVSKRTVHRDLATLVALGAPIIGEAGVGYVLRPGFLMPPLMFSEDELEALALGGLWAVQRGDNALALAADNALAKIAAVLPISLMTQLDHPRLLSAPPAVRPQERIDMAVLRAALRGQRRLIITYEHPQHGQGERIVWPVALVFFDAVRLLAAWCENRQAFRHFRTDRIIAAHLLPDRYPQGRAMLLKAWRQQEAKAVAGN